MMGDLSPTEEAILDRSLIETYRMMGITTDPETQMNIEPPVMEDLYKVLLGSAEPEARGMAEKLERYIKGSMAGIFDQQSNINLDAAMTVFSTKNLEDKLRPIAFYMILDFIWTRIKKDLRRRILIVEEAWYLMQNEDSAQFLFGIAKRARKYYLGMTTITQDVGDFLHSDYGAAIVSNSSIQILLKQHPSAIDKIAEVFYLSEGEKRLLLAADRGEGLFFAGSNHVAIKVMASEEEHKLITTNPEEILKMREESAQKKIKDEEKKVYKPNEKVDLDKFEDIKGLPVENGVTPTPQINKPDENKPTPVAHIPAPAAPPPPPEKKPELAPNVAPNTQTTENKPTPVVHIPAPAAPPPPPEKKPELAPNVKPGNTMVNGDSGTVKLKPEQPNDSMDLN